MKKILCFLVVLLMLISCFAVSASEAENERVFSNEYYHTRFLETFRRLGIRPSYFEFEEEYRYHNELMVYKNNDTVEYTLVFPMQMGLPKEGYDHIGKYVLDFANYYDPYIIGYYVYVASADEIYTLTEAYDMNISGISEAFEYLTGKGRCAIAGDADMDGKLNIKDATMIQKQLAGLVENNPFVNTQFRDIYYGVKDFNLDEEINIKDATAIQKHIAGITE